jgi:hypothetical protein
MGAQKHDGLGEVVDGSSNHFFVIPRYVPFLKKMSLAQNNLLVVVFALSKAVGKYFDGSR